jgi:hypothetical protein
MRRGFVAFTGGFYYLRQRVWRYTDSRLAVLHGRPVVANWI